MNIILFDYYNIFYYNTSKGGSIITLLLPPIFGSAPKRVEGLGLRSPPLFLLTASSDLEPNRSVVVAVHPSPLSIPIAPNTYFDCFEHDF